MPIMRLYDDAGPIPMEGDLAMVREDFRYESGTTLKRGQNVLVTVIPSTPYVTVVGIRWRDDGGTHVAAIDRARLEVVL